MRCTRVDDPRDLLNGEGVPRGAHLICGVAASVARMAEPRAPLVGCILLPARRISGPQGEFLTHFTEVSEPF